MAGRTLTKARPYFPALVQEQLNTLERDLGGRAELCALLVMAPLTADLKHLLGTLGDPRNQSRSLGVLCTEANVLPGKVMDLLASAALLRGKVLAHQQIGQGIAAVAADVMRRAAPFEEACHACVGSGSITPDPTPEEPNPVPGPCETCQGMGKLRYLPDLDRQRLAVDMAQLIPKGGGINIGIQQVNGQGAGSAGVGALEQLQSATDQILYGEGALTLDPLEGEVLDTDSGTPQASSTPNPAE